VVSCAEFHRPRLAVVENVPEFLDWQLYPAWALAMRTLGYAVSPHILDAADYGTPQNRKRLFVVLTRSKEPFRLRDRRGCAQPSIAPHLQFDGGEWRKIDGTLAAATQARIANGRARFGDRFLTPYYGSGSGLTGRSIDRPIGTITTKDRWSIVDGDRMRILNVDECRAAMGFPANYKLPRQKALAKHMLGNAVCPPLMTEILNEVLQAA
jgi:DNA (cytosine-5)-methyltransferase 1